MENILNTYQYSQVIYPNAVDFEKLNAESSYSIDEKFNLKEKSCKLLLLGNFGALIITFSI